VEYLTLIFDIIKYFFLGFFGLVIVIIILTIVFGDQIKNKGHYQASFFDGENNATGRFRAIIYRYTKKDKPEQLKIKFSLKHPQIVSGAMVKIYIEEHLFYEIMTIKKW